jgi:transmembrane sensor
MTNSNLYENLISRYLNGSTSEEEKQQLLNWINASAENKNTFLEVKDSWDSSRKTKIKSDEKLLDFYNKQAASNKRIPLWQTIGAVAAVLLIGLFLGILIPKNQDNELLSTNTFSVPLGSKSEVILPDGSKVQMNSGSKITYPSNFQQNNRNVTLSGEAFFQVHSDPIHPFTVQTKDFEITVTGTHFNVCNYNDDNLISATLVEGIIDLKFNNQSKATCIKPGEKLSFNKTENKATIVKADLEIETAWKSGEFIFKEIDFADLVVKLERWYDVKLNYSDSRFNSYKYTGRFKNQETIWQVLDALKLTSPIDYKRQGFRKFNLIYKPK